MGAFPIKEFTGHTAFASHLAATALAGGFELLHYRAIAQWYVGAGIASWALP